jgi:hypothetical protein
VAQKLTLITYLTLPKQTITNPAIRQRSGRADARGLLLNIGAGRSVVSSDLQHAQSATPNANCARSCALSMQEVCLSIENVSDDRNLGGSWRVVTCC